MIKIVIAAFVLASLVSPAFGARAIGGGSRPESGETTIACLGNDILWLTCNFNRRTQPRYTCEFFYDYRSHASLRRAMARDYCVSLHKFKRGTATRTWTFSGGGCGGAYYEIVCYE